MFTLSAPTFVGPHEGRELELMMAGTKPLSMFVEPVDSEIEIFPEEEFDRLVSQGRLVKRVHIEPSRTPDGAQIQLRHLFYALPGEAWRIDALLLARSLDLSLPGPRPDLDRLIGLLLGYAREDVEAFVRRDALR